MIRASRVATTCASVASLFSSSLAFSILPFHFHRRSLYIISVGRCFRLAFRSFSPTFRSVHSLAVLFAICDTSRVRVYSFSFAYHEASNRNQAHPTTTISNKPSKSIYLSVPSIVNQVHKKETNSSQRAYDTKEQQNSQEKQRCKENSGKQVWLSLFTSIDSQKWSAAMPLSE